MNNYPTADDKKRKTIKVAKKASGMSVYHEGCRDEVKISAHRKGNIIDTPYQNLLAKENCFKQSKILKRNQIRNSSQKVNKMLKLVDDKKMTIAGKTLYHKFLHQNYQGSSLPRIKPTLVAAPQNHYNHSLSTIQHVNVDLDTVIMKTQQVQQRNSSLSTLANERLPSLLSQSKKPELKLTQKLNTKELVPQTMLDELNKRYQPVGRRKLSMSTHSVDKRNSSSSKQEIN